MAYSNGYDVDKVLPVLRKRVGWKQIIENSGQSLTPENIAAESGRHYEDFHGTVTVGNVQSVLRYEDVGDEYINDELSSLKDNVIMTALSSVFSKPVTIDQPTPFFERRFPNKFSHVENTNQFVGYRVNVAKGNYVSIVHGIELMFDKAATFEVFVYSEFKTEPLYKISVTVVANELLEVPIPNWVFQSGRSYYIGYYQNDLQGARALDIDVEGYCYSIIGKQPVSIPAIGQTIEKSAFSASSVTFGLNVVMSSYQDYTDSIIRNAHLFDEMQGLQMAILVIGKTMYTNRANMEQRIQQDSLSQASFDMNAEATEQIPVSPGLRSRFSREVKRLTKTFFKADSITVSTPNP